MDEILAEKIIGCVALLLSLGFFALWFHLFKTGMNFRNPDKCKKCKGVLRRQEHIRNAVLGRHFFSKTIVKNYLKFVYVYQVDGKEYLIDSGLPGKKGDLPTVVDVVYQTKKPQRAYIKTALKNQRLTVSGDDYIIISFVVLPVIVLCVVSGFVLIV